jgi:FtsZ-binding cell division protein ZapB
MELSDGVIGAILGAITGAGGLGGLFAWVGKRGETNMKIVGQYYGELSIRLTSLESVVLTQQDTIGLLRADNAELRAENKHLHDEILELRAENAALRYRVDELADLSEVSG